MIQKIALIIAYTVFGLSALAMIGFALVMVGYLFWILLDPRYKPNYSKILEDPEEEET